MANTVKITIEVDDQAAAKAFAELTKDAQKASNEVVKSLDKMDVAIASFAANVAADIFQSLLNGAKDLFDFFLKDGIAAANQQEDAINELNIALKNTGLSSSAISKDLQEFSSELQKTTKFADEFILKNIALIQSIGNLSGESLKDATRAALDLSAALGIDLTTAATMLGKAAQGEIGTFKRYGVAIEKGKDDAETFANTLDKLNSKFGGAAAGQINTFSGAQQQLNNTLGDVQEKFGEIITQNPAVIAAFKQLTVVAQELEQFVKDNQREFDTFVAFLADTVVVVFETVAGVIKQTVSGFNDFLNLMKGAATLMGGLTGSWDSVKQGIDQMSIALVGGKGVFGEFAAEMDKQKKAADENAAANERWAEAERKIIEEEKGLADERAKKAEKEKAANDLLIAEETRKLEEIKKIKDEFAIIEEQEKIAKAEADLIAEQEGFEFEKEFLTTRLNELAILKLDAQIKEQEALGNHLAALKLMEDKARLQKSIDEQKASKNSIENLKKESEIKKAVITDLTTVLTSIAKEGSREAFLIQKASAAAQAIVALQLAIAEANALPWPANIPAIIKAVALGTSAIKNIASSQPPGFASGGVVVGNLTSGDQIMARVNSREMILNQQQQANLFDQINGGQRNNQPVTVNIQGNVLADDENQIVKLIDRINDAIQFNNAVLTT